VRQMQTSYDTGVPQHPLH